MDRYEEIEQLIKERNGISRSLELLRKDFPILINVIDTRPFLMGILESINVPKNCREILIQALESDLKEVEERLNDYLT